MGCSQGNWLDGQAVPQVSAQEGPHVTVPQVPLQLLPQVLPQDPPQVLPQVLPSVGFGQAVPQLAPWSISQGPARQVESVSCPTSPKTVPSRSLTV